MKDMETIDTIRFGHLEVSEEQVIRMPKGMLGFPEDNRFVIIRHDANSPFCWYQSLDDPALAFVIINPALFKPDYRVETQAAAVEMEWTPDDAKSAALYVVVTIPKNAPEKMTANLVGPILINHKAGQAVQMVLSDTDYSHQHPIMDSGH